MSIQINWDALAGGPDGEALAETIRAFIHEKFQNVTLPRFIRSVKVHSFDFGSVAPELELKDVCDPLPDFYEENEDSDPESDEDVKEHEGSHGPKQTTYKDFPPLDEPSELRTDKNTPFKRPNQRPQLDTSSIAGAFARASLNAQLPYLSRVSTPGIPGGTSNMGYFHLPLSAGLSGAATPLATAVGAQLGSGWPEQFHPPSYYSDDHSPPGSQDTSSTSRRTPHSTKRENEPMASHSGSTQERSVDDVQIVMRLKYSGNVKLSLTADILLDYPMPSFVGIPLKLNVTGLTFDGVAIVAYIKEKAHFCFLGPEDADALIGRDVDLNMEGDDAPVDHHRRKPVGGLFEEIKVESEIGQKTNGRQVLKNVGKVEKFVLEQVRAIFETEFVYPSYWTFLV